MRHASPSFILLAYTLITISYSIINPLFEAPDEHHHYFTAQYIADTGTLPSVETEYDEWMSQEAAQPPLYYLIAAQLLRGINTTNIQQELWLNPHFPTTIGNAATLANRNFAVHTPAEAWPWHGYALAAHLLRFLSVLFGLGTLLCIYGSGRLLWPEQPQRPLLATTLIAFLPQFNFLHASITNDTLIIFLASLTIWQLIRLWQTAVTPPTHLLYLSLTIGLAILTKTAGILLLLYTLGFLFWLFVRNGRLHQLPQTALTTIILPVLLIAGWLWWRNWTLYGDITAANQFIRLAGGDRHYTLWQVLRETPSLWHSLFAIFGWFNLRPPEWLYTIWNGWLLISLAGVTSLLIKKGSQHQPHRHPFLSLPFLLAIWPLTISIGLITFMLRTSAAQGRLILPAIVPLSLAVAYGLSHFRWAKWLLPMTTLLTTLYALLFVIRPAYTLPPQVATLPATATPLSLSMGQGLTLAGVEIETTTAVPFEPLWLTLYWQANSLPHDPPEVVFELFGHDPVQPIAKLQSYHGRGLFPANLWPSNSLIADRVAIRTHSETAVPVLAQLYVQLLNQPQEASSIGTIKLTPTSWPQPSSDGLAILANTVQLTAVSLTPTTAKPNDTVTIEVEWLVHSPPNHNLTTFVHLAELGHSPLAQGDSPPLNGRYPTSIWATDELIHDSYTITIPTELADGRYPIWLGLYDPNNGTRLQLTIDNTPQPHNAYLVDWLTVQHTP